MVCFIYHIVHFRDFFFFLKTIITLVWCSPYSITSISVSFFFFFFFKWGTLDELSNHKGCFHKIKRLQNSKTSSVVHPENGWKNFALGLLNTVEHQAVTEPRSDQQMAQQTSQRMIKSKWMPCRHPCYGQRRYFRLIPSVGSTSKAFPSSPLTRTGLCLKMGSTAIAVNKDDQQMELNLWGTNRTWQKSWLLGLQQHEESHPLIRDTDCSSTYNLIPSSGSLSFLNCG